MKNDFNPEGGIENSGPGENEGFNQEGLQKEEGYDKPRKKKQDVNSDEVSTGGGETGEWHADSGKDEEEEVEGEEEDFEEGEEDEEFEGEVEEESEYEEVESFIEEQIDAIGERVKNYIMKSSDTKKMKDLVKYGSLAALAVYGLRRGGLLRGLVISTAVSMAAKHLMAENGKQAA